MNLTAPAPLAATVFALGLLACSAHAAIGTAPYTIVIKDSRENIISCPPSGLSFTGSQLKADGSYPAEPSPAPSIKLCGGLNPQLLDFTFDNNVSLQVRVAGSSQNGQHQGQNVAGLEGRMTGTKIVAGRPVELAIDFTTSGPDTQGRFSRNYTIYNLANNRQVAIGTYHITSQSSVPEPHGLALLAIGLLGLVALTRRPRS